MAAILNFRRKSVKHKIASISLTVGDRAISSKFSTPRVEIEQFRRNFDEILKNGGHFNISQYNLIQL